MRHSDKRAICIDGEYELMSSSSLRRSHFASTEHMYQTGVLALLWRWFIYYDREVVCAASLVAYVGGGLASVARAVAVAGDGVVTARSTWGVIV